MNTQQGCITSIIDTRPQRFERLLAYSHNNQQLTQNFQYQPIVFDTIPLPSAFTFDGTSTFTVPAKGTYSLYYSAYFDNLSTTTTNQAELVVSINSTVYGDSTTTVVLSPTVNTLGIASYGKASGSTTLKLNYGDTIKISFSTTDYQNVLLTSPNTTGFLSSVPQAQLEIIGVI